LRKFVSNMFQRLKMSLFSGGEIRLGTYSVGPIRPLDKVITLYVVINLHDGQCPKH